MGCDDAGGINSIEILCIHIFALTNKVLEGKLRELKSIYR